MPVHLVIQDGPSPHWWESQDIWVVPGSDPNSPPSVPIAGQTAYLWARVANNGNVAVKGARVDFYWANPAAEIRTGVANLVGSAYVDVDPSDAADVLCLVPWVPVIVNDGHECIVAVVHGGGDINPIPNPLPNGYLLDAPAHEQIAQRNLNVVQTSPQMRLLTLTINGNPREDKSSTLALEFGHELDERTLLRLGLRGFKPTKERHVKAALDTQSGCHEGAASHGKQTLEMHVRRGTAAAAFLSLRAPELPKGEYELLRVVERRDEKMLGGVSYVVVNQSSEKKESRS